MESIKATDVMAVTIDKFPYKGNLLDVKGISVRWLSRFGDDGHGYPDYGLRLFTAAPGGEIPIHNHFLSSDHVHPERLLRVLEVRSPDRPIGGKSSLYR